MSYPWSSNSFANNYTSIEIESDSTAAIHFVKHGCVSSHPCYPLLEDITNLLPHFQKITWLHTLREANFAADKLAKKGHDLAYGIHIFDISPPDVSPSILRDISGIPLMRGAK
ncbi:hypothetical protein PIB30_031176 [Stylosanthes scabra]|uniref:RNase H type-1 domain-containing protein n=1 Tax=Stylosanthes scabra TaxID=79078 RepID=A0ABU6QD48_9FABA|nr:hypothetical protein [Stylosanthes scabra]